MLSFTGGLKVFLALEPVDLRKSFGGLEELVSERLGEDLRQGALFVFSNRRHTRLKILYWDGTGLWLLIKRLEQGTFSWPKSVEEGRVKLKLTPEALALLTDGIDLRGAKMRPENAARSFTPSSSLAAAAASIPSPICARSLPGCPP